MRKKFQQNSAFFQNQKKGQDILIAGADIEEVNQHPSGDMGGSISEKGM